MSEAIPLIDAKRAQEEAARRAQELRAVEDERRRLVAGLRQKNAGAEVLSLELGGHFFVVRSANRETYARFQEAIMSPQKRAYAGDVLITDCLLHPEAAQASDIFDRRPGYVVSLQDEILKLSGVGESLEKKAY